MTELKQQRKKKKTIKNTFEIEKSLVLLKLIVRIIIKSEGQNIKYIESVVEEIDKNIMFLSMRTLASKPNEKEPFEVSRLKELAWTLLESIESYCKTNLNASIW